MDDQDDQASDNQEDHPRSGPLRVVVIGSGFGGLFATKALRRVDVEVILVSRTAHHLFQPMLYQVTTGILSEGQIAPATREVLSRQKNARVLLSEVTSIDLGARTVTSEMLERTYVTPYDRLIVAAGASQSYFGNDRFAEYAPGMKTIDDALELRGRIFSAFELAESSTDPADIDRLLTFVVVGAGPTGVELAGQITELAHRTMPGNFRRIDPAKAKVVLLDAGPAVLPSFGNRLSDKTLRRLQAIDIDVQLSAKVVDLDATGVEVEDADGTRRRIPSVCKIWAAGVAGSSLGAKLAEQSDVKLDSVGRVKVRPDLTLPGHPEVFVVGDMISLDQLPGVAQVAIQGGRYAANQIKREVGRRAPQGPFEYHDKGSMAAVSRFDAVVSVRRFQFTGFMAWLMWLALHLFYIIGFKKRITTLLFWTISFLGRGRPERAVTEQQVLARTALQRTGTEAAAKAVTGVAAPTTADPTGATEPPR
ncbi:MAG: NAD(P)/FAD-dependent oxidoreductase [Acidimicrobiales bacterium]